MKPYKGSWRIQWKTKESIQFIKENKKTRVSESQGKRKMIIPMSLEVYKTHEREGDGICQLCQAWSYGTIDPDDSIAYCTQCENSTVLGIKKARESGLIEIQ